MPPPPWRKVCTSGWPSTLSAPACSARTFRSAVPPGANELTISMGREGYGCATADALTNRTAPNNAIFMLGHRVAGDYLDEAMRRIAKSILRITSRAQVLD